VALPDSFTLLTGLKPHLWTRWCCRRFPCPFGFGNLRGLSRFNASVCSTSSRHLPPSFTRLSNLQRLRLGLLRAREPAHQLDRQPVKPALAASGAGLLEELPPSLLSLRFLTQLEIGDAGPVAGRALLRTCGVCRT